MAFGAEKGQTMRRESLSTKLAVVCKHFGKGATARRKSLSTKLERVAFRRNAG